MCIPHSINVHVSVFGLNLHLGRAGYSCVPRGAAFAANPFGTLNSRNFGLPCGRGDRLCKEIRRLVDNVRSNLEKRRCDKIRQTIQRHDTKMLKHLNQIGLCLFMCSLPNLLCLQFRLVLFQLIEAIVLLLSGTRERARVSAARPLHVS